MNVEEAHAALTQSGDTYAKVVAAAAYDVGFYRPVGTDPQGPHLRDEIYIVQSGNGVFSCDGIERPFAKGDMLLVRAGVEHRFVEFTPDFATWVVFFGAVPGR